MNLIARPSLLALATILLALAACKAPTSGPAAGPEHSPAAPAPSMSAARDTENPSARDNAARRGPRARKGAIPGNFDFYLLTLSWSPEFCATHTADPECAPRPAGPYGFLVHGLWPQNNDGTFPEHCSNAPGPADPAAYSDIIPDASLVAHEWTTHGTCSGLAPDAFFQLTRQAFHRVVLPAQFTGTAQPAMLPPAAIISSFAQANPDFPNTAIALSCGNNRLTAIEFCLSKSTDPIACQAVKTCRANTVKITPR